MFTVVILSVIMLIISILRGDVMLSIILFHDVVLSISILSMLCVLIPSVVMLGAIILIVVVLIVMAPLRYLYDDKGETFFRKKYLFIEIIKRTNLNLSGCSNCWWLVHWPSVSLNVRVNKNNYLGRVCYFTNISIRMERLGPLNFYRLILILFCHLKNN